MRKKNEFLLHCRFARGLQGAEEGAKGTLTFIPASISSSPHLPPSFLAYLSPHCTSSSKIVFSTGGFVFFLQEAPVGITESQKFLQEAV